MSKTGRIWETDLRLCSRKAEHCGLRKQSACDWHTLIIEVGLPPRYWRVPDTHRIATEGVALVPGLCPRLLFIISRPARVVHAVNIYSELESTVRMVHTLWAFMPLLQGITCLFRWLVDPNRPSFVKPTPAFRLYRIKLQLVNFDYAATIRQGWPR